MTAHPKSTTGSLHEEDDIRIWIASYLSERLGIDARSIDPSERLSQYGLDSRGAVDLVSALGNVLGRAVSPVLIWHYPSPETLARYLAVGAPEAAPIANVTATDEPIAIVGIACRFPRAPSPDAFWELLRGGIDAITEVPRDRWDPDALEGAEGALGGGRAARWGGFLERVDGFDPLFFGISPREARAMDPQQRLMLELSWEALEDARMIPETLKGTQMGVFFGSIWDDHATLLYRQGVASITQHTVTGHHRSILANRVSYVLGVHGPSMTVDTACSASLVATHLACESLRRGESSLALAGGVNLTLAPESAMGMNEFGGLSPDGKCFTFDARANGYVRGEGGAVVVLKRLSRAIGDGDPIHAVIRGSAVNNGGAANGLTAPNPAAQEAVLRLACARAGIAPREVQYVELHGTGTALGDPIEAAALGAVFGEGRSPDGPLRIGSAKTNIGHLEGAAGIAGLVKTVLCMKHRQLVPSLHFDTPNPHIDFEAWKLAVETRVCTWPDAAGPRIAGVSSFGMGGTNCHVVLSEWDAPRTELFARAAPNEEALRAEARAWLAGAPNDGPSEGPHRLAIAARSKGELERHLRGFLEGRPSVRVREGHAATSSPKVVFVFAGQGVQWAAMGRRLLHREPVFRKAIERCDRAIRGHLGWSLIDALSADAPSSRLDEIDVSLPAIISVEIAMSELWRAWGITPAAVVGHSGGEIAAAHVAGVLSLDDAMLTICAYGRLLRRIQGKGTMGVVGLPWDEAATALTSHEGRLFRAIQHGADSTVIAGDPASLDALFASLERRNVFCRRVAIDIAAHCPHVEAIRDDLFEALREVRPRTGTIPIVSEVTGTPLDGRHFDAAHWVRNVREPALFAKAIDHLLQEGLEVFVEVSPHPFALHAIASSLRHAGRRGVVLPSLRRDEDEHDVMLDTLGALFVRGASVRWDALHPDAEARSHRDAGPLPVLVSGKTEEALRAQATALGEWLAGHPDRRLVDVAASLATTRSHFARREALVVSDRRELQDGLEAIARGERPRDRSAGGRLAFLFAGQGSQHPGMGRSIYARFPAFRDAFDAVCAELDGRLDVCVRQIAFAEGSEDAERLHQTVFTQAALFAVEVALFRLFASWNVRPDVLLGHSIGELVAGHVAGVVSLEDACTMVAARARLMQALPAGVMVALTASEGEVLEQLAGYEAQISLAAVNGPRSTVVAGDEDIVRRVASHFEKMGRRATRLRVGHAFHSPHVQGMLQAFESAIRPLTFHPPQIPIVSNVTGKRVGGEEMASPGYWLRHARETVRFLDGVRALESEGVLDFLEIGPGGALCALAHDALSDEVRDTAMLRPTLGKERPELATLASAIGALHTRGRTVDWKAFFEDSDARLVPLPTYAFQRERHDPERAESLHRVEWIAIDTGARAACAGAWAWLGDEGGYVDWSALAAAVGAGAEVPGVVVASWRSDETDPVRAAHDASRRCLALLRGWIDDERFARSRLVVLTHRAIATAPDEDVLDLGAAPLWGLVRTAQTEAPDRGIVLADVDDRATARRTLPVIANSDAAQWALRHGRWRTPRIVHIGRGEASRARGSSARDGTVVVTGGTGALGALIARHLVARHGVRHLVLVSRQGESAPGAMSLRSDLEAAGARVEFAACDLGDRDAVRALLASIPEDRSLGIVHAAGVIEDGLVNGLTDDRLARVLRPKVDGSMHLHESTKHRELSFFVLFSSVAGLLGTAGQGNYAAANAFVDALAQHRRALGLPATSLAWGLWEPSRGMGATLAPSDLARMARLGMVALTVEQALGLFDAALARPEALLVPARFERNVRDPQGTHPLLRAPAARTAEVGRSEESERAIWRRRLAELSVPDGDRALLELVRAEVAAVIGQRSRDAIEAGRPLAELGLGSLMALELTRRLRGRTGVRLPATLLFDHPTPTALAERLRAELLEHGAKDAHSTAAPAAGSDEPMAVVAMSCRFPGGVGAPEDLWHLLEAGADAISRVPDGRGWDLDDLFDPDPDAAGKSYVREGGFVDRVDGFDADFFGISPREAVTLDPQQRLLLEIAWELFERAGMDPSSLQGSPTGTFVGINYNDYGARFLGVPDALEGHVGIGSAGSVASGRIAYTFGLEGPAISVDTACSSSLVAIHLAAQALRRGECSLALAGGVTLMATPSTFIEFSRQRALSPDGRCKAFSALADGTGWAEGAALLLLERLSDAQRLGHPVLGLVRGSAVNQDGRSQGLTAPNGPAQQRVIRQALLSARLSPEDVDAVEAHGTGTALGDPIEAQALLATYGAAHSPEFPLWLGSLKSNLGHTQAAAGVAGVIKMLLAFHHRALPKTLHADPPSPHVDWSSGSLRLLTSHTPWPRSDRPRHAAVSSFGISGTNAHLILEEPPARADATPESRSDTGDVPLLLSAKSDGALRDQAARIHAHLLAHLELSLADLAHSLVFSRTHFDRRAVVVASERAALLDALEALAHGATHPHLVVGDSSLRGKLVFVFPGQGGQWDGMARSLFEASTVFRNQILACAKALDPYLPAPLLELLLPSGDAPLSIDRVDVVQPLLFAVLVSLAALLRSLGVHPDAVVGHSQGEIAAACVAGALSLDDAAKVVALRSRALASLAGSGAMASVEASPAHLAPLLASFGDDISVAAVNGPRSTVLSGSPTAIDQLLLRLEQDGVFARKIRVDYASHSLHVEPLRDLLLEQLRGIEPRSASLPLYSTVTGDVLLGPELGPDYWFLNLRQSVRFHDATSRLLEHQHRFFLEISPHPVLALALSQSFDHAGVQACVSGTLRREHGDLSRVLLSLSELLARGFQPDWHALLPKARIVPLPTYPFQRARFWLETPRTDTAPRNAWSAGPEEARFWQAAERGDVDAIAAQIQVADDDRASLATVLPALSMWRTQVRRQATVDACRYRVAWRTMTLPCADDASGAWWLVHPAGASHDELVGAIRRGLVDRGASVHDVAVDDIAAMAAGETPRAILSFCGLDGSPPSSLQELGVPTGLALTLRLVQALGDAGIRAPLWSLTCGAVRADEGDPAPCPSQAMIWGLGRVVALEHPERWGGLIDLPKELDERALASLVSRVATCTRPHGEDQLALRARGWLTRRLVRAPLGVRTSRRALTHRGTALITGGTGGLGAHVARWLANRGVEHLVLVSRRGPEAPGAQDRIAELAARGVRVSTVACDVADRRALATLLERLDAEGAMPSIVVHAAGVTQDRPLAGMSLAEFAEVVRAKVEGARHLDELIGERPLDAFVLFSSGAGVWGSGNQGAYAASNAFLDALAERRRASGKTATAIAWGAWAEVGMARDEAVQARLRRRGIAAMSPDRALLALQHALEHDETAITVADIDWARFVPAFAGARAQPLIAEIPEAREALASLRHASPSPAAGAAASELLARFRTQTPAERNRDVLDRVLAETAAVLGRTDARDLAPGAGFFDLGLDSLMALELRRRLQSATGVAMPATLAFDHPSPERVAAFLLESLGRVEGSAPPNDRGAEAIERVAGADDAIAIVGIGLRLPGGVENLENLEDLWRFLERGGDAVGPLPRDRWDVDAFYDPDPEARGKSYVRHGACLDRIDRFDAPFFGIRPTEAAHLDPQQRLLLETSWHALEDAGIVPGSLRESLTGVFVGMGASDYASARDAADAAVYAVAGGHASFGAGRLAFSLGLQGPALSVDTACSSSLVALHLACQSLRRRECHLALAAGVHVMASAQPFVLLARTRALAPDGRCKTFSGLADGYGRGEGVVVLALERLSDARTHGHPVLALVRGSAMNHDGHSSAITAPNGTSQQKVLRAALADAGLAAGDIDYVECHGTGTSLGDPIEMHALGAVHGTDRDRPLRLGSLKANIGHLEPASGLAGVAKVVAALRYEAWPPAIHSSPRNPLIDWDAHALEVVDALQPWPARSDGAPRRAGVSAFGLSGTNSHVVIEEVPTKALAPREATRAPAFPLPYLVSAKSDDALRAQASRLHAHLLEHPDRPPLDVAHSLAIARSHFPRRAAIVAHDRHGLLEALDALAGGRSAPGLDIGDRDDDDRDDGGPGKLAFLFSGQGSQRPGMGRALYDAFPVFRDALDDVRAHLDPLLELPLGDVLFAAPGSSIAAAIDRTGFTQPALFAIHVALFRLLESWGVRPDFLLGHSIGELSAAHVADVFSLTDACALIATRARLLDALPQGGAMFAVHATEEELRPFLIGRAHQVSLAAVNSPRSCVVSGELEALASIQGHFAALGRNVSRLRVSHAFHSPLVDPILDDFRAVARTIAFSPPRIPIVSNVSGRRADPGDLVSPEYWVQHLREPVRFFESISALDTAGVSTFVELGPGSTLCTLAQQCLAETDARTFLPSLRRDAEEPFSLLSSLASMHTRGHAVDWSAFFRLLSSRVVSLPGYAFRGQRHWLDATRTTARPRTDGPYALSGQRIALPDGSAVHTLEIGPTVQGYLEDHAVYGRIIVPGAFYMAVLLAIAATHWPGSPIEVGDVQFVRALGFEHRESRVMLQVHLVPREGGSGFSAVLRTQDAKGWTTHVTAVLDRAPDVSPARRALDASGLREGDADLAQFDAVLRALQIDWGPRWWWMRQASLVREGTGFGRLAAPEGVAVDDAPLPAGLIDNAFALELCSWVRDGERDGERDGARDGANDGPGVPRLPFAIGRFVWYGHHAVPTWAEHVLRAPSSTTTDTATSDLSFWDAHGTPIAHIEGFTTQRAPRDRFLPEPARREIHHVAWEPFAFESKVILHDDDWIGLGSGHFSIETTKETTPHLEMLGDVRELEEALERGRRIPHVIVVPRLDGTGDLVRGAHGAVHDAIAQLQTWLASERLASCHWVVLTRRAVSAGVDEGAVDLIHAPVWGLVRAAQCEHPDRRITLVDIDDTEASRRTWVAAALSGEPQLALRAGTAYRPRIAPVESASNGDVAARRWDPNGTVLVTGGTGALGAQVARHLVAKHGARHLVLASRRGRAAAGADALARELEARGARVSVEPCDVSDRSALERLLARIPSEHPLTAVVHAAGTLDDGVLTALTPERVDRVLAPKLDAAVHLHRLTERLELSAFVLFSSLSGVLGNAGQASYAAANVFLDALASQRRSMGLPAIAIAWGPWNEGGMAAHLEAIDSMRMRRQGVLPMSVEDGLRLFDAALERAEPLVVAAHFESASPPRPERRTLANGVPRRVPLERRLSAMSEPERHRELLHMVNTEIASTFGLPSADAIAPKRPLQDYGMDSLVAVELRNRLNTATGLRLPATLLFDHATPFALAERLHAELVLDASPQEMPMPPELERLESVLAKASFDERTRARVAARLRALSAAWSAPDTATSTELFDALDREFEEIGLDE